MMTEQTTTEVSPETVGEAADLGRKSVFGRIASISTRTKIIVGAVVLALAGGGGAMAYTAYQSPDMVVATALASIADQSNPSYKLNIDYSGSGITLTSVTDIASSDKGSLISAAIDAQYMTQKLGATLNVVQDSSGNVYLNLAKFDSLGSLLIQMGLLNQNIYATLKSALTDQWIKLSKQEVTGYTSGNSQTSCLSDLLTNKSKMESAKAQLADTLRNNDFIVVTKELPNQNGSRVFQLGFDAAKLRSFLTAAKATTYWASVATCYSGLNITDAQIATITQTELDKAIKDSGMVITLAADSMSHKLTSIDFTLADQAAGTTAHVGLAPTGDQSSKVVIPAKSIDSTQLAALFMTLGGQ